MKLPFTKARISADIQKEIDATISRADALTSQCIAAERQLEDQAGDMDLGDVAKVDRELEAMKRQRTSLMLKADQLATERDALAAQEAELVKAEQAKTERRAHADAIRRLPSAVAAVQAAHAALNDALAALNGVDPYAGALATLRAAPALTLPEGFSSSALTWPAVTEEATRVRTVIMNGGHLNYSIRDDYCSRNVAASKIWGYI